MKQCSKCGEKKPSTTEHFNMLPSGNLRGACKKCMAVNTRNHYYRDPQRVMDRVTKYKKQIESAGGYCSDLEVRNIREAQDDRCAYCGVDLKGGGELDHKTPVSRGGNSWPSNMAWTCRTCNRDKHNKTNEEFSKWRIQRGLSKSRIH